MRSATVEDREPDWEKAVDAVTLFLVDNRIGIRDPSMLRKVPTINDRYLARKLVEVVQDNV